MLNESQWRGVEGQTSRSQVERSNCYDLIIRGWGVVLVGLLIALPVFLPAQNVTVAGRARHSTVVFDDSLLAAVTKSLPARPGHGGWHDLSSYQFSSAWVTFTSDASDGFFAGAGFTTGDTVRVTYEGYADPDTASVNSSTVGFVEHAEGARKVLFDFVVGDTTNPRRYVSFHGSGDPELALMDFVRFHSEIIGTLTSPGLGMRLTLKRQP